MLHIADKVIQLYEDPESFKEWLEKMRKAKVLKHVEIDGDLIHIGGTVSTCLWLKTDPISNLVCLAFALLGPIWPYLPDTEEAFKKIRKWWRRKIREAQMDSD